MSKPNRSLLPIRDKEGIAHQEAFDARARVVECLSQSRRDGQENPELREGAVRDLAPMREPDADGDAVPLDMVKREAVQKITVEGVLALGVRSRELPDQIARGSGRGVRELPAHDGIGGERSKQVCVRKQIGQACLLFDGAGRPRAGMGRIHGRVHGVASRVCRQLAEPFLRELVAHNRAHHGEDPRVLLRFASPSDVLEPLELLEGLESLGAWRLEENPLRRPVDSSAAAFARPDGRPSPIMRLDRRFRRVARSALELNLSRALTRTCLATQPHKPNEQPRSTLVDPHFRPSSMTAEHSPPTPRTALSFRALPTDSPDKRFAPVASTNATQPRTGPEHRRSRRSDTNAYRGPTPNTGSASRCTAVPL